MAISVPTRGRRKRVRVEVTLGRSLVDGEILYFDRFLQGGECRSGDNVRDLHVT